MPRCECNSRSTRKLTDCPVGTLERRRSGLDTGAPPACWRDLRGIPRWTGQPLRRGAAVTHHRLSRRERPPGHGRSGHAGAKPVHRRPVKRSQVDRPPVRSPECHAGQLLQQRPGNSPKVLCRHRTGSEGVLDPLDEVGIHIFEDGCQPIAVESDETVAHQRGDPEPAVLIERESIGKASVTEGHHRFRRAKRRAMRPATRYAVTGGGCPAPNGTSRACSSHHPATSLPT